MINRLLKLRIKIQMKQWSIEQLWKHFSSRFLLPLFWIILKKSNFSLTFINFFAVVVLVIALFFVLSSIHAPTVLFLYYAKIMEVWQLEVLTLPLTTGSSLPNIPGKHLISDKGCVNSYCCLTFQNIFYLSFIIWTSLPSWPSLPSTLPSPTCSPRDMGKERLTCLLEVQVSGLSGHQ